MHSNLQPKPSNMGCWNTQNGSRLFVLPGLQVPQMPHAANLQCVFEQSSASIDYD